MIPRLAVLTIWTRVLCQGGVKVVAGRSREIPPLVVRSTLVGGIFDFMSWMPRWPLSQLLRPLGIHEEH